MNRTLSVLVVTALWGLASCHGRREVLPAAGQGPQQYSAVVVRTVRSDGTEQIEQTRISISGGMSREDWNEGGERRALILRPDLGLSYLLSVDKRTYTELPLNTGQTGSQAAAANPSGGSDSTANGSARSNQAVAPNEQTKQMQTSPAPDDDVADWVVDSIAEPSRTEEHPLPDVVVDGHRCQVSERVAYFSDGHLERIRTYKAADLSGLALRVETQSQGAASQSTTITERRDIQLDVPASDFSVPSDYKRLNR